MSANIMVIDDTPGNLELLENILTDNGFEARLFLKGEMALKSADKEIPDLILLDIMMPEMDGFEVCKRLKSNTKLKEIPVIFISAKGDTIDKVKAFESGGVDYITKPFHIDEVIARVETHYNMRIFQKELEEKNRSLRNLLNELANTQNQLVQAEKMASLGTLTAGIAHEINNPINAVNSSSITLDRLVRKLISFTTFCLKSIEKGENNISQMIDTFKEEIEYDELIEGVKQLTGIIINGAERTTRIIESLKIFTHLDQAEKKSADIHKNIESTLALLHHRIKDKITIERQYGNIPPILCYPGKLNQVFMNLLTNAIDSLSEKDDRTGTLTITIKTEKVLKDEIEHLQITISDTGSGIRPEIVNRLFEPFFSTKNVGEGSGLGLSISHGIIKNHKGKIDVRSELGKGTSFIITIPGF